MLNHIILTFLLFNAMISLIIFNLKQKESEKAAMGYLMLSLLVPIIGSFMCLVMAVPFRKDRYAMDSGENIHRLKIEQGEYVDSEYLKRTVPINDALTLSDEFNRRGYMLGLLRHRSMESLRETLHQAVYNEDPEISHYAAAAIMEMQRISFSNMEQAARSYVPGPAGSYKDAAGYAISIMVYLQNSEIGELKNYAFRKRYEEVLRDIMKNHAGDCTESDYENMVAFLETQGRLDEAWQYAETYAQAFPRSEAAYMAMLRVAYRQGNAGHFAEAFDRLHNSEAVLSSEALAMIRFWRSVRGGNR